MKLRKLLLIAALLLPAWAHAAPASPVSVSSIAISGVTVTIITASPHGLAVNQGFCLTFAPAHCSAVSTVPDGTHFTYTQPVNASVVACPSSCGSVSPMKRIIWSVTGQDGFGYTIQAFLWTTTTSGVLQAGRSSAWSGASAAENAAIAAGNVIENVLTDPAPAGTTLAAEQNRLVLWWIAYQAQLAGSVQPGQFFGDYFDGSGWLQ